MRILYAGDSEAGGPANYLLGILRSIGADVTHIPPAKKLSPPLLQKRFDAMILSDFSRKNVSQACQKMIAAQVGRGTGLLMVGGWGSFSGPFGRWRGSLVEKLLPVRCLKRDDRLNFPGGASIVRPRKPLVILRPPGFFDPSGLRMTVEGGLLRMTAPLKSFKSSPVICGLNQVRPKKDAIILLTARRIVDRKEFPLLIVNSNHLRRTAALATDLAPHWCGGLVDWGRRRRKLRVTGKIQVEVGESYVRFVSSLIRWLAGITRNKKSGEGF